MFITKILIVKNNHTFLSNLKPNADGGYTIPSRKVHILISSIMQ